MKIRKTLRKLTAIAITLVILSGMLITSKADYNPVNMYYCDNVINWRGSLQFNVYVQIDAGSAANKQVIIHYNAGNGKWEDKNASYLTTIDGNKEIWVANISGFGISGEYAIKYIGDGITYWDNNNGKNYTNDDILGVANVEAIRAHYQTPNNYYVYAAVKNIGNEKKVTVRYTQNNWVSYEDVDLSYYHSAPDGKDFEYWNCTLNLDEDKMDDFQYCIRYEVNGQTFWDNNFGRNYDKSFYRPL